MFIVNSWKWICSKISKGTTTTITYSLRFVCFDVIVFFFCSAAAAVILPFHFVHILILLQCYKTKSSYTLHHQMNVNAQHQHLNRNQMAEWLYYIVLPYYAWILVVLIAFSLANQLRWILWKTKTCKIYIATLYIHLLVPPTDRGPLLYILLVCCNWKKRNAIWIETCLGFSFIRNEVIAPIEMDIFGVNYAKRMKHKIQCIMTQRSK